MPEILIHMQTCRLGFILFGYNLHLIAHLNLHDPYRLALSLQQCYRFRNPRTMSTINIGGRNNQQDQQLPFEHWLTTGHTNAGMHAWWRNEAIQCNPRSHEAPRKLQPIPTQENVRGKSKKIYEFPQYLWPHLILSRLVQLLYWAQLFFHLLEVAYLLRTEKVTPLEIFKIMLRAKAA